MAMTAAVKTDDALERLVFFSDAVFAIAITLLILEVRVPVLPRDASDTAYLQALAILLPSFIGYIVSFWVIGMFWIGHHRAFSMASRHSRRMLGWNLFLLGIIAFMPFATAFFSLNAAGRVPTLFYCVTLLLASLLNMKVVRIATGPEMVDPQVEPDAILYCRRRSASVALGAVTAIALAFFAPRFAQAALITIPGWRWLLVRRLPKAIRAT
jgi:uncharacterized membrane protein